MSLLDVLYRRYTPRGYADRPLPDAVLRTLFEAARWAPSSYNRQPWRFLVARQGTEAYAKLLDTLAPANRAWAQTAPVLVLGVAMTEDDRGPNRYAEHDLGMASGFLTVQAADLGVYPSFMAGFDKARAAAVFSLPPQARPMTVIALGYPEDPNPPAGRSRLPLEAIVFDGAWDVPFGGE